MNNFQNLKKNSELNGKIFIAFNAHRREVGILQKVNKQIANLFLKIKSVLRANTKQNGKYELL